MPGNDQFSNVLSAAYEDRKYFCELMGGADGFGSSHLWPKYVRAVQLAKTNCAQIKHVLDIGCGRGELVNYFCARGIEAVGIDYSRTACEIAGALLAKNPRADLGTILNIRDNTIPYPDGYFDVAFMLDVVEHLYATQLDEYYAQLRRLLRPDGILVIHTWPNRLQRSTILPQYELLMRAIFALPYRLMFRRPIKRTIRDSCEKLVHVNEHTPGQLSFQLARHGFKSRVFTSYFSGSTPDSWSDFLGEVVLNAGPLGLMPGLRKYLNRYLWAIGINQARDVAGSDEQHR